MEKKVNLFLRFMIFVVAILLICSCQPQKEGKVLHDDVPRPVSSKTVSVLDYGAVGNGKHDDAMAIQKALDSGAEVVTIPPGVYSIGGTLWIGSGVTLKADPQAVIRLADGAGNHVSVFLLDHSVIRPNQNGIHVGGFSQRGIIRRIRAVDPDTPNDDMVALNADDDVERVLNLGMRRGPIRDIMVEDLQADGAYTFVRILSKESVIKNITVRRVKGSCRFYAVNMTNWRFPIGSGDIRNVRLEQFNITKTDYKEWAPSLINIKLKVRDLYIRDFQRGENPKTDHATTLFINNGQENTIQSADDRQQSSSMFSIPQGGIRELWINRSSNLQP